MTDQDRKRQQHDRMLNELADKIKPPTVLFIKFKFHVIGSYLPQSEVLRCHDITDIITKLEHAEYVQPGHYDVLLKIFRDIGCKDTSIMNVIKECAVGINQGVLCKHYSK